MLNNSINIELTRLTVFGTEAVSNPLSEKFAGGHSISVCHGACFAAKHTAQLNGYPSFGFHSCTSFSVQVNAAIFLLLRGARVVQCQLCDAYLKSRCLIFVIIRSPDRERSSVAGRATMPSERKSPHSDFMPWRVRFTASASVPCPMIGTT